MRIWLLAVAIFIAGGGSASAQWTQSCVGPGNARHEGAVCQCPAGSKKVRFSQGDLADLRNTQGQRRYNCVRLAKPIEKFLIFFDFGQEEISTSGKSIVGTIAEIAKKEKVTEIEVIGHTDTAYVTALSYEIALARAEAVKTALVSKGIPAPSISTQSEGKSKLLVLTPDGTKEPQNRRVEIHLFS